MNFFRCKKGFTVVELMTVVTILSILIAIVTPLCRQYIASAEKASCENAQDYLENAVEAYKSGAFPYFYEVYLTNAEIRANGTNHSVNVTQAKRDTVANSKTYGQILYDKNGTMETETVAAELPYGNALGNPDGVWDLGTIVIAAKFNNGFGSTNRDFIYYSHDNDTKNAQKVEDGGIVISGSTYQYSNYGMLAVDSGDEEIKAVDPDSHARDKYTSADHTKFGLGRYVYQSGVEKDGTPILKYIDCETEQERFLRYAYAYKGDMKDFVLYSASESCQLTISSDGAVYCTNPTHHREYRD